MRTPEPGLAACDDHAVADVHADVADRAVVEDQVARLQVGGGDAGAGGVLGARGVRQRDAGLGPGHHRQARAVEGAGAGGAVDVGVADLGHGVGDSGAGATGGRDVATAPRERRLRCAERTASRSSSFSSPSSSLASASLASIVAFSSASSASSVGDLVDALLGGVAADREGLETGRVVVEQALLELLVGRHRRDVVEEALGSPAVTTWLTTPRSLLPYWRRIERGRRARIAVERRLRARFSSALTRAEVGRQRRRARSWRRCSARRPARPRGRGGRRGPGRP